MTWGNELRSENRARMGELCQKMRAFDPTRLYAEGSNTWYGGNGINPDADFVMAQQNYDRIWRGAFAGNHGFVKWGSFRVIPIIPGSETTRGSWKRAIFRVIRGPLKSME